MTAELETLALPELVDRLEDLDGRRTPIGWSPDDAVERAGIERRILALVAAATDAVQPALHCPLEIQLRSKEQTQSAGVREIRTGGIYIDVGGTWIVGTHVDMMIRQNESDEHGLRARGIITLVEPGAVLVSVAEQPTEAHERRLRRFVLELLRHRLHEHGN